MSKPYYHLYSKVWHPLNLWAAYKQAARGKRSQPAAAAFEYHLEEELIGLEEELRSKGTHRALDRCTHFLRRNRYVMHCDVRQYFPSIDHQILRSILSRTIGDRDIMGLIDKILTSGVGVQAEEYDMVYFPGDDLLAACRPRGLPIGNLTSQHWANVYLNELDQYAKRVLKCRAYIRFVDDILLFSQDKKQLQEWRQAIILYMQGLRLTLHENCAQPRPVEIGVPFLGFVVFPDHRRLKRRNGFAFQRRLKTLAGRCRYWLIRSPFVDGVGWGVAVNE